MIPVAFIGLGTMGYPMAGHLARKGFDVTVFNRTTSKAEQWCGEYGGRRAPTPAAAARGASMVFICVGNDQDLESVILGAEGVAAGMEAGAIVVDHSTVSATLSRRLADALADLGVAFIDAPVSGGQQGAQNGQLAIMCGGDPASYERVRPVMASYARATTLMGPSGSGQLTKMVNQICVAGLVEALAEGMHFAAQAGLDVQRVIDVISQGAAASWQMVNRHKSMIAGEYEHGFAVDWMRKDLAICLEEARQRGVDLPVTALVDTFYGDVQAMGGRRWDTSSLLARLQKGNT
ncbi:MAG: 6-phosphogluconate dehydrogenase [Moraxellaceae bacterium]|jgi:3-hydroxyisobutyrate dehydrogenase|nr:6-phosphogluconate dehydrogenase [Moraxellaceae bacterium]